MHYIHIVRTSGAGGKGEFRWTMGAIVIVKKSGSEYTKDYRNKWWLGNHGIAFFKDKVLQDI